MVGVRRMHLFACSLAVAGLTAGYGSLLILWSLGGLVSPLLHRYPGAVVLSLAVPLFILQVAIAQWLLGVRLTKIDGHWAFRDKPAADR